MVLALISYVVGGAIQMSRTNTEGGVAGLPRELGILFSTSPARRSSLQFAQNVVEPMRRFQTHEEMYVILYPSDRERNTSLIFHDSTHVTLKVTFESSVDEGDAVFCAKDQMIMQRSMCRWHMGVRPYRDFAIRYRSRPFRA